MMKDLLISYYNLEILDKEVVDLPYKDLFIASFNIEIISYFVSIYISYMELTSICENCKKLGVKMPDNLEDKIKDEVNNEKEKF